MRTVGQLFGTMIAVALVIVVLLHLLPWLAVGLALIVAYKIGMRLWRGQRAADAAEQKRLAAIRRRADEQHHAMLSGDTYRGVFGDYPPAQTDPTPQGQPDRRA